MGIKETQVSITLKNSVDPTLMNIWLKKMLKINLQEINVSEKNVPSNSAAKRINSTQLFLNAKEIMIDHLNETYLLRLTKQNKLILTKK